MLYHWSVHNKLKTKKERKHISILIRFFHFSIFFFFLTFSLLGRVILSRSSFIQTSIFVKTSFWSFFNMVHFFNKPFYSRQDNIFFSFSIFSIFLKKTNETFISSFFYSKINYPITRKEQNENPFFSRIQNTFFGFDKSQIFES